MNGSDPSGLPECICLRCGPAVHFGCCFFVLPAGPASNTRATSACAWTSAATALTAPYDLNYFEVEYSARLNDTWSYELGAERTFNDTFARSEVRLTPGDNYAWSAELLKNLTEGGVSFTTGISRKSAGSGGIVEEWLLFYSYTSPRFGARALLAEDFVGFGHSSGLYLSGAVSEEDRLSWFTEIEVGETRSRLKIGLSLTFGR